MKRMSEFQAVIMAAGSGSRMYPLTENIPKALLPIGNLPMIWYPINLLEKSGFEEVIVVVLESTANQVSQVLTSICGPKLRPDVVAVPDADAGTADSLRHIREKIKKDFLVLSCDLITDVALHRLADIHRSYDASVTALFAQIPETSADREAMSNPKAKTTATTSYQRDYIGLDSQQDRLLLFAAEADLEENLTVRKSLLQRYPCINIVTSLMDAHLYIFKKWVVDFLSENKSINSVKGELVPYLVKKQFHKKKKVGYPSGTDAASVSVGGPEDNKADIFGFVHEDNITSVCRDLSSWSDSAHMIGNCIRCHAYVMDNGLCLRSNTLPMYMEANRLIPRQLSLLCAKEISLLHPSVIIKPKSQVGKLDCMVDECVSIGEKVSVKKSVIGKHSTIGEKVKITSSVIMDHVTIKEGCNIQGSIICTNAYIKENAVLKDCQVGNSHTIQEGADLKGEAIVAGQMMDFE